MRSYVGNTGFLWERSILHVINSAVGSGRIKGIKVVAILRYEHKFRPEYRASLKTEGKKRDGAKRSLPSEAKSSERSEEVTSKK